MSTNQKQPLRVVGLQVKNVMGVKAVAIEPDPDGNLIVIGGDNGAGKTSTIDSIWWALGGKPSALKPIRDGESEATIELDLGDLKVIRRFWHNANTGKLETGLKVSTPDGAANYSRPQEVLDGLLSKFAFDPFEFTRLKPKDQVERLKVVLGIDASGIEARRKEAYDERTIVNRTLAALEAKLSGLAKPGELAFPEAPAEEISLKDLTEELNRAHEQNRLASEALRKAEASAHNLRLADTMITAQENTVGELRKALEAAELKLADMSSKRPLIEKIGVQDQKVADGMQLADVDAIENRMEDVEETNRQVRVNKSLIAGREEWKEADAKKIALTEAIAACDKEKQDLTGSAIAAAKIAVAGLTFDEDGLWIEGIPFSQTNTAEQLKVSVALAVHENPRLRVYRISDGEKLTPKNMKVIGEIAAENDAQIFVEFACTRDDVANGYREVSFLIEEGEVAPILTVMSA
jgi:hypothetical protein